jgi:hypothetical protein
MVRRFGGGKDDDFTSGDGGGATCGLATLTASLVRLMRSIHIPPYPLRRVHAP